MKISITCITPVLQAILDFFPDIISFQHVFHLGVGRSQIEWKLKAKTQISVFPWAKIGQNDHSNPYIESTTVLSDNIILMSKLKTQLHAVTPQDRSVHVHYIIHRTHLCIIGVAIGNRVFTLHKVFGLIKHLSPKCGHTMVKG